LALLARCLGQRLGELGVEAERVPVEAVRKANGPRREAAQLAQLDPGAVEAADHRAAALGSEIDRQHLRRHAAGPCTRRARRRSTSRARRTKDEPFGISTESRSSVPVTTPVACWLKFVRKSAFWSPANTAMPSTTPTIVPRPPKIETPPRRTTVTTLSSSPRPLSWTAVDSLNVYSTPANEQTTPERTNSISFARFTRMPAYRAA